MPRRGMETPTVAELNDVGGAALIQGNLQHESFSTRCFSQHPERQPAQSSGPRYGQSYRTSDHDYRSHQYGVSVASLADDVYAWPDGLPPVHAYMGDDRKAHPGTTALESQSVVGLGSHHAAGVQLGLSSSPALMGPEHSVHVCRVTAPGPHDLATAAGKLRACRNYADHQYGNLIRQRHTRSEATSGHWCCAVTAIFKRVIAYPEP